MEIIIVFLIGIILVAAIEYYQMKGRKKVIEVRNELRDRLQIHFSNNVKLNDKRVKKLKKFYNEFHEQIFNDKFSNKVIPFNAKNEEIKIRSKKKLFNSIDEICFRLKFGEKFYHQFTEVSIFLDRMMVNKNYIRLSDRDFAVAFLHAIKREIDLEKRIGKDSIDI